MTSLYGGEVATDAPPNQFSTWREPDYERAVGEKETVEDTFASQNEKQTQWESVADVLDTLPDHDHDQYQDQYQDQDQDQDQDKLQPWDHVLDALDSIPPPSLDEETEHASSTTSPTYETLMEEMIDNALDPEWVKQGVKTLRNMYVSKRNFTRQIHRIGETAPLVTRTGKLTPPPMSHDGVMSWYQALIAYLGQLDFSTLTDEVALAIYVAIRWYMRGTVLVAMLPVQPEWLDFQRYFHQRLKIRLQR